MKKGNFRKGIPPNQNTAKWGPISRDPLGKNFGVDPGHICMAQGTLVKWCPRKLPSWGHLGRVGRRYLNSWVLNLCVPVFSQGKKAHCGTDTEKWGGAIAACRASWAGEGTDAGISRADPGGGSDGNRAIRPCSVLLKTTEKLSSIWGFRVWSDVFDRHMLITSQHHHYQLFNCCLRCLFGRGIMLGLSCDLGLGVWDWLIKVNRHIKEIHGCLLCTNKYRVDLLSFLRVGDILHSVVSGSLLLPHSKYDNIPLSLIVWWSQTC